MDFFEAKNRISLSLTRNIIDNGNINTALVTDYPSDLPSGSEVNANGGRFYKKHIYC